jgi:hypothetical protein
MLRAVLLPLAATLALGAFAAGPAMGESAVRLFKIVTVKDEIIVGLTPTEAARLGAEDAGAIAAGLSAPGGLTVWRFAVRKNAAGGLEYAPLDRVALLPHESLRVEPYKAAIPVIAPQP